MRTKCLIFVFAVVLLTMTGMVSSCGRTMFEECDDLNLLNITTWHTCCKGVLVCKRIRLAKTTVGLCHPPECLNTIGTVRCPYIWEYHH